MRTKGRLSVLFAVLVLFFCQFVIGSAKQAASEALTSEEVMILLDLLIEKAESAVSSDGEIANAALIEKLMKMADAPDGLIGGSDTEPAAEATVAAPGPEPQPEDEPIDCVMEPVSLNQVYSCAVDGQDAEFAINIVW